MATIKINNKFEAENISTACVNPDHVTFDIWNTEIQDFVEEKVNIVEALQGEKIDIRTAAAILRAAGMSWIVATDNSESEGYSAKSRAEAEAAATPKGLDTYVLSVEEYLRSILGI